MLQHWLKPSTYHHESNNHHQDSFYDKIKKIDLSELSEHHITLAIIGVAEESADLVRSCLFPLKWHDNNLNIIDLGNLNKPEEMQLQPILQELIAGNICPIIISSDEQMMKVQSRIFQKVHHQYNWAVVDEILRFLPGIHDSNRDCTLLPIAHQIHFLGQVSKNYLAENSQEGIRLSELRQSIEEAEVILRNADIVSFHVAALRQSEAPGQLCPTPNGLFGEEWCSLARLAGVNDAVRSFGIYGYAPEHDNRLQTAQLVAQAIYYFCEGYVSRVNDFPFSQQLMTEFNVEISTDMDTLPLKFWQSSRSGRWWFEVMSLKNKIKLTPCSYQDFLSAKEGNISDRISNLLSKHYD